MDRRMALQILDLARDLDGNISHVDYDRNVRTFLIWNAQDALNALEARDVLDDVKGASILRRLQVTCPECFYDLQQSKNTHAPDCGLGAEGWSPAGRY